jgi:hypothetical protein
MKLTVSFKTPDAAEHAVFEALEDHEDLEGIEDAEELLDKRLELEDGLKEALSKWIQYSEYVRIEFDTEAGTATVLPAGG